MSPPEEALAPFQRAGLDNLRNVMKRQGLTHAQLADRAGINRATVTGYLSGRRLGDPRYHAAIAEALDQDPGLFFPRTQCELDRAWERGPCS